MNTEELKKEYVEQDNRGTAYPIYVTVQELFCVGVMEEGYSVNCPYGDEETVTKYRLEEGDCDAPEFNSEEELKKYYKEETDWGEVKDRAYVYIRMTNHPFCTSRGYVFEHRLVVEKQIGRYLLPQEKCHHLGAKDDNRPHMLMAFVNQTAHVKFEKSGKVKKEEIVYDGRNQ